LKSLVTGGGGFLGRYIVEQLLKQGREVRILARGKYPELQDLGVECHQGDIRKQADVESACEGVDSVFHVAAIAGIWGRWEDFYEINTVGTQHVLAACKKHRIRYLVFCSSPSVTFNGKDQQGVDEQVGYPEKWLAHYPHTKALAEKMVLEAASDDLKTCALRPHLIWGPRDNHLIPRLIERAQSGKLRIIGDGKNLVDMVYVENAASAHLQAESSLMNNQGANGKAYFITQGAPVRCWDWINEILALKQLPPIRRKISTRVAFAAGALLETGYKLFGKMSEEPRMTRFLATQLSTDHYFDISAARNDLKYRPLISTEEGMRRLGDYLSQSG